MKNFGIICLIICIPLGLVAGFLLTPQALIICSGIIAVIVAAYWLDTLEFGIIAAWVATAYGVVALILMWLIAFIVNRQALAQTFPQIFRQ